VCPDGDRTADAGSTRKVPRRREAGTGERSGARRSTTELLDTAGGIVPEAGNGRPDQAERSTFWRRVGRVDDRSKKRQLVSWSGGMEGERWCPNVLVRPGREETLVILPAGGSATDFARVPQKPELTLQSQPLVK
jgi:hypothetical protein